MKRNLIDGLITVLAVLAAFVFSMSSAFAVGGIIAYGDGLPSLLALVTEEEVAQPVKEDPAPSGGTTQSQVAPTQEPAEQPAEEPAAVAPAAEQSSETVYVTPTGDRYHYRNNCTAGKYSPTTLGKAKAAGLTPCKRCAGG